MKRIRLLCAGVMHLTDFLLYAAFAVCRQRNLPQKFKLYERLKANIWGIIAVPGFGFAREE